MVTAALSGFCNPSNPLDSHQRCAKADCPCIHHRMTAPAPEQQAGCACPPCPGRGNDGHGMTHCAECCFGTGVEADLACPVHGMTPVDPVTGLQDAVEALGKAMPDLVAAADDPQALGLARLLFDVREARTALYQLEQDLEGTTAKALMADELQGEGVRVERYRSRDRKEWDHETWRRDVRAKVLRRHGALKAAAVVTADGEPLDVDLYALLADVQDVHGASAPKVTALRQLGLDAADYCKTEPGTAHVRVTRLADETPEVE